MLIRLLILAIMGLAATGCNSRGNTRPAPPLAQPTQAAGPEKKNLLQEVGDTTVRIVQEPVRMVTPKPAAPTKKPEEYQAPQITIIRRGASEAPPTSQP